LFNLDEAGQPVPVDDVREWVVLDDPRRVVAYSLVGSVEVSTVFLGMDLDFLGKGQPVLWETMVFGGRHDKFQERYTTRAAAEIGHERVVTMVKDSV
jgi:hypothetical protein